MTSLAGFSYYKVVWKEVMPKKIKIFIWLALRDWVHANEVLVKKGWAAMSGECPLCGGMVKSNSHLFLG